MPTVRPTVQLIAVLVARGAAADVGDCCGGCRRRRHYFSYHPDESVVLGTAMGMDAFNGKLLPHFYNYGTAQLYLVNFANSAVFLFGGVRHRAERSGRLVPAVGADVPDRAVPDGDDGHRYRVGRVRPRPESVGHARRRPWGTDHGGPRRCMRSTRTG